MDKYLREEYQSRINSVLDYIEDNLDGELTLERLAGLANFSPFHFHRIFRAMVGEPLNQFIQRIRVEKAAMLLIAQPKRTITEIALDCGFSGPATFARSFRDAFGMTASRWQSGGGAAYSKARRSKSKIGKMDGSLYFQRTENFKLNEPWKAKHSMALTTPQMASATGHTKIARSSTATSGMPICPASISWNVSSGAAP